MRHAGYTQCMPDSAQEFVSEPLVPAAGSADVAAMSRGEPGVPGRFTWREREYSVVQVLATWKTSTADRGEMYLRRHWFQILTDRGVRMTIYCERQARNRNKRKARWWVYSVQLGAVR